MIEYLDKSPTEQALKKEEDMISYQIAAIKHVIRESVPKSKHINILFSLVHQVQEFIDGSQREVPATQVNVQAIGDYTTLTPVPVNQLDGNYREIPLK